MYNTTKYILKYKNTSPRNILAKKLDFEQSMLTPSFILQQHVQTQLTQLGPVRKAINNLQAHCQPPFTTNPRAHALLPLN